MEKPWYSFGLWNYPLNADVILQPDVHPGNCWVFQGSQGQVTVKLARNIRPAAVTMQHIPRAISLEGNINSAPKEFEIYGLNEDGEHTFLGQFSYRSEGDPTQSFRLWESTGPYKFIRLQVLGNWGNPDYTCIFRLRVHQELQRHLQTSMAN